MEFSAQLENNIKFAMTISSVNLKFRFIEFITIKN